MKQIFGLLLFLCSVYMVSAQKTTNTNIDEQYEKFSNDYKSGKKNYDDMPHILKIVESKGDKQLASELGRDYINGYLMKLPSERILKEDKIRIIGTYVTSEDKQAFAFFWPNGSNVNAVMGENYNLMVISRIIYREEINDFIASVDSNKTRPITTRDWRSLEKRISRKYNSALAEKNILIAKMNWFKARRDWNLFTKATLTYIDKYLDYAKSSFFINNTLFQIVFKHVNNKSLLIESAKVMKKLISAKQDTASTEIDTYSNLLYKAGKKTKAIEWQRIAVDKENADSKAESRPPNSEFQDNLTKMEGNLPTW